MKSRNNLEELRLAMLKADLGAYIITGADPHGSEYPPVHWETRAWISGFGGSAGSVVVTAQKAGLWTDSRYWIQAKAELHGSGISLFPQGAQDVLDIPTWLIQELEPGKKVAIDGRTVSRSQAKKWEKKLKPAGISFLSDIDLISALWIGRPALEGNLVRELTSKEAGESRRSRFKRLRNELTKKDCTAYLSTALDAAAWLLNIRGTDVQYNPVVLGFLIVLPHSTTWFTRTDSIPNQLKKNLAKDGIKVAPYEDFFTALSQLPQSLSVLAPEESLSCTVFDCLPLGITIREGGDPVSAMKACKNSVELQNLSQAMEKDGLALLRFFRELESLLHQGEEISEWEAAKLLRSHRSALPGFLDESFSPILGYAGNGAIIHYKINPDKALPLKVGPFLFLVDSGAQWQEGTTDVTRTIVLGEPSEAQRKDYSLVLKGHIALSRACFPQGTCGYQLDTLARLALWAEKRDYNHGTGHGVGYRLNVHEGPQTISTHPVDVALEPGMIVSNEPGLYREKEYGIRIENLLVCRKNTGSDFGTFLKFDTLTLFPYDRKLIDTRLLDRSEIEWIDSYHAFVQDRLRPLLSKDEAAWLKAYAAPLLEKSPSQNSSD